MSTRIALLAVALLAAAAAWWVLRPPPDAARTWREEVAAENGPVGRTLRELGVLAPRDPLVIQAPFTARLQWIVADGTWVEAGADLFILSDEDEVKRIAELRSQLVQARAELRLARLKREHGEQTERPKRDAAERSLALAEFRRRLVDAKPVGGLELVRIAEALRPLNAATVAARRAAEAAQDDFQRVLDGYLGALDAWQANRDALLRLQARIDELEASPADQEGREAKLAEARQGLAGERERTAGLAQALEQARRAREELRPARDASAAALAAAEQAESELRFRAEVEKKALALARLQLDERQAVIDLDETRRQLAQTTAAVAAGSLARSEQERLQDQLQRHENALEVVRARIAIASRPPDERALAEADAQLVQARTAAEDARGVYDRAIASLQREVELKEAQVSRLELQIDQRSSGFASVLESGVRFAERELAVLGPEDADERSAVEAQLARLRAQLAQAAAAPPNIARAPVAGLVRVSRWGDRARQAGDQCWEADPVVELLPPANMDVALRVNEVDIGAVKPGQRARVAIPTLGGGELAGEVVQIAGVGRDKFSRPEYAGKAGFADVVDFEVRVRLDGTTGLDLRQGMAARVEIDLGTAEALRLPRAAVRRQPDGSWAVQRPGGALTAITGQPADERWFAVASGLAAGDTVVIERTRNR